MRRLLFSLTAGLLLAAFPLTCHFAPRLLEYAAPQPDPAREAFLRDMEAVSRRYAHDLEAATEEEAPAVWARRQKAAREVYRKHGKPWPGD